MVTTPFAHMTKTLRRAALAAAALALAASTAVAQGAAPAAATPAARPADVATPDAIIKVLYDVISGDKGQPRDWDRFRSLFAPGARLMPTGVDSAGKGGMRIWTPEEFVAMAGPRFQEMGFFEREISRKTERFGNVLHAFSTYESRRLQADPKPFSRGINSIQLFTDGTRWYVVTIFWDAERPGNQIPRQYLP